MADVKLSDGREITFDLYKVSLREFRALLNPERPDDEGDELLGRCSGLSAEEIGDLPYPDFRKLTRAFYNRARNPLADPNSVSESISTSE